MTQLLEELKKVEAPSIVHIDGYNVVEENSSRTGSSGSNAEYPAMSKEVAEALISKYISTMNNPTLCIADNARFVHLSGGRLHDNRTGKTYKSKRDYKDQN